MSESGISTQVFEKLREDPENQACCDCFYPDPSQASITFGTFICSHCATSHMNIQGNIVKALTDNDWEINQLKNLTAGGNTALHEFFTYYGIDHNTPIDIKYRTNAADYYKHRLVVVAAGESYDVDFPSRDIGVQIAPTLSTSPPQASEESKAQQPSSGLRGWISSAVTLTKQAGNYAYECAQPAVQKVSETSWGVVGTVQSGVTSVVEKTKTAGNAAYGYISEASQPVVRKVEETSKTIIESVEKGVNNTFDKFNEIAQHPQVQAVKSTTTGVATTVTSTAKSAFDMVNNNPRVQNIKQETMELLNKVENKAKKGVNKAAKFIAGVTEEEVKQAQEEEKVVEIELKSQPWSGMPE